MAWFELLDFGIARRWRVVVRCYRRLVPAPAEADDGVGEDGRSRRRSSGAAADAAADAAALELDGLTLDGLAKRKQPSTATSTQVRDTRPLLLRHALTDGTSPPRRRPTPLC